MDIFFMFTLKVTRGITCLFSWNSFVSRQLLFLSCHSHTHLLLLILVVNEMLLLGHKNNTRILDTQITRIMSTSSWVQCQKLALSSSFLLFISVSRKKLVRLTKNLWFKCSARVRNPFPLIWVKWQRKRRIIQGMTPPLLFISFSWLSLDPDN